jgi:hypothetical protein
MPCRYVAIGDLRNCRTWSQSAISLLTRDMRFIRSLRVCAAWLGWRAAYKLRNRSQPELNRVLHRFCFHSRSMELEAAGKGRLTSMAGYSALAISSMMDHGAN